MFSKSGTSPVRELVGNSRGYLHLTRVDEKRVNQWCVDSVNRYLNGKIHVLGRRNNLAVLSARID
jgi:hypothetical protein